MGRPVRVFNVPDAPSLAALEAGGASSQTSTGAVISTRQTVTVTRRNVAGIEVLPGCLLWFWLVKS